MRILPVQFFMSIYYRWFKNPTFINKDVDVKTNGKRTLTHSRIIILIGFTSGIFSML